MTGQWEAYLHRIQRKTAQLEPFLKGIEEYVVKVVGKVGETAAVTATQPLTEAPTTDPSHDRQGVVAPPPTGTDPTALLRDAFGFSSFRASQEVVCRTVIEGRDVLLVMPTGSGKSLCYQLPGIARGGTTLVISPLIALMEDQLRQLKDRGVAVERIH